MADAEADKQATAPDGTAAPETKFFTTPSVYVFLRQYHMLYERLLQVKNLCTNDKPFPKRVKHVVDRAHEEATANAVEAAKKTGDSSAAMDVDNDAVDDKNGGSEQFSRLLALAYAHISGALDTSKFEDECRTLLGPDVFVVFTIDKVVSAIQKQLSAVVADTKSGDSVAALKAYLEKDKPKAVDLANVYQCFNQHVMQPEGTCLRMRFLPGAKKTPDEIQQSLSIKPILPMPNSAIVQPSKSVVSPWSLPPRLCFSLTDELPIMDFLPENNPTPEKFPAPCPVQVDFAQEMSLSVVNQLSSSEAPAKGAGSSFDGANTINFPVYKFIQIPATDNVEEVIKAFTENQASGSGGPGGSVSNAKFFMTQLVPQTTNPAEKGDNNKTDDKGIDSAAKKSGDTEMKDA